VFVSPDLTLEEYWILKKFLDHEVKKFKAVVAYKERKLSEVEQILVSPDHAANFRGAQLFGLAGENIETEYNQALESLKAGSVERVLLVGDRAILAEDRSAQVTMGLSRASLSIGILSDAASSIASAIQTVIPERTCLEKSGVMVNREMRMQYVERLLNPPSEALSVWTIINAAAKKIGQELIQCANDRELTLRYLKSDSRISHVKISDLKNGGVSLTDPSKVHSSEAGSSAGAR
jgi:NADH dehydrogenase/NADH:ubiquinone oxidoreductase subunit G